MSPEKNKKISYAIPEQKINYSKIDSVKKTSPRQMEIEIKDIKQLQYKSKRQTEKLKNELTKDKAVQEKIFSRLVEQKASRDGRKIEYRIKKNSPLTFGQLIAFLKADKIKILSPKSKSGEWIKGNSGEYYREGQPQIMANRLKFKGKEVFIVPNEFSGPPIELKIPEFYNSENKSENQILQKARNILQKIPGIAGYRMVQEMTPDRSKIGTYLSYFENNEHKKNQFDDQTQALLFVEGLRNRSMLVEFWNRKLKKMQNIRASLHIKINEQTKNSDIYLQIGEQNQPESVRIENIDELLKKNRIITIADEGITKINEKLAHINECRSKLQISYNHDLKVLLPSFDLSISQQKTEIIEPEKLLSFLSSPHGTAQIISRLEKTLPAISHVVKKIKAKKGKIVKIEIRKLFEKKNRTSTYIDYISRDTKKSVENRKTIIISTPNTDNPDRDFSVDVNESDINGEPVKNKSYKLYQRSDGYQSKIGKSELLRLRAAVSTAKSRENKLNQLLRKFNEEMGKPAGNLKAEVNYNIQTDNFSVLINGKIGTADLYAQGNLSLQNNREEPDSLLQNLSKTINALKERLSKHSENKDKKINEITITDLTNRNKNISINLRIETATATKIAVHDEKITVWNGRQETLTEEIEAKQILTKARQDAEKVLDEIGRNNPSQYDTIKPVIIYNAKNKTFSVEIAGVNNNATLSTGKINISYYDFEDQYKSFLKKTARAIAIINRLDSELAGSKISSYITKISFKNLGRENAEAKINLEISEEDGQGKITGKINVVAYKLEAAASYLHFRKNNREWYSRVTGNNRQPLRISRVSAPRPVKKAVRIVSNHRQQNQLIN